MARPLRVEFPGAWYHVMNRGANRRPVFSEPRHYGMFLALLGEVSSLFRVEIHAYCLMGNHYHLLARTPEGGLWRAMRHLSGLYTQRLHRRCGTDGPLFRGRYRAILVDSDSYLLQVSRYIHLNPVTAGLAARPEDYALSSYRAYVGMASGPTWLYRNATIRRLGEEATHADYRAFVEAGVDDETRAFYGASRIRPVYGSTEFTHAVDHRVRQEGASEDPELPAARIVRPAPGRDRIMRAVSSVFMVPVAALSAGGRFSRGGCGLARGAAVLVARLEGRLSLREIAEWLGYSRYTAASQAMARFRAAARRRPELRERLERARHLVRAEASDEGDEELMNEVKT